jgi:tRNA threonylcarbamoyladenosine biosynthesis protein TsaE
MMKNNFIGKKFTTYNFKETQKLGYDFAGALQKGEVICLYGELGSGKTTFTQGLAQGLGIKNRIISPTFVIIRSHSLKSGMFYHVDLYRIETEKDIENLGLEEIMNDPKNIVVIEWAEKLKSLLPKNRIEIKFVNEKENLRKIVFSPLNQ